MIKLQSPGNTIDDLNRYNAGLVEASNRIGFESGGLASLMLAPLLQLDRFVAGNIQVDTGRVKNSIFPHIGRDGNGITAGLYSNVKYSPYVGHMRNRSSEQFFKYAARVEGPKALAELANRIVIEVEDSFG